MQATDKARLISFYEGALAHYGADDPRSLHWISAHTQRARFQALYEVGPWEGASVADIGCGLGDLYGYLREQGHGLLPDAPAAPVQYVGYDLSPKLVTAARLKYPEARFQVRDILEEGFEGPCDYVVASGTFNVRITDHEGFFRRLLAAMYSACRRAVAFNFLGSPRDGVGGEAFYYEADPDAVMDYCRSLCDRVVLKEGYLTNDFTVFMHRTAG